LATHKKNPQHQKERVTDRSWRICHGTHQCAAGPSAVLVVLGIIAVAVRGEQQHVSLLVTGQGTWRMAPGPAAGWTPADSREHPNLISSSLPENHKKKHKHFRKLLTL
jgi:hypothetical protein